MVAVSVHHSTGSNGLKQNINRVYAVSSLSSASINAFTEKFNTLMDSNLAPKSFAPTLTQFARIQSG